MSAVESRAMKVRLSKAQLAENLAIARAQDVLHAKRTDWDEPIEYVPTPRELLQREIDESVRESKRWERYLVAALVVLVVGGFGLLLIAQIAMALS